MASSLSAPPSPTTYPNSFFSPGVGYHSVEAGTWIKLNTSGEDNLRVYVVDTQNAKIRWSKVRLAAGTYTIFVGIRKGVNQSYCKVDIDSQIGVLNYDAYNAGDTYAHASATGIILAEGEHTIDVYNPTKNASAGEYGVDISYILIFRTA